MIVIKESNIKDYRIQGIYGIRNKINNKIYVGQASVGKNWKTGIYHRIKYHLYAFRKGIHSKWLKKHCLTNTLMEQ